MIFKPILGVCVLCVSMVTIMAVYYSNPIVINRDTDMYTPLRLPPKRQMNYCRRRGDGVITNKMMKSEPVTGISYRPQFNKLTTDEFCNDKRIIPDDPCEYVSENQRLVGPPNPKTMLPIMDVTKNKSHDLADWKSSDFTVHSMINDEVPVFDTYTSGYGNGGICRKCARRDCACIMMSAADRTVNPSNYAHTSIVGMAPAMAPPAVAPANTTSLSEIGTVVSDELEEVVDIQQSMDNIFDPRFSGYGPTDRCYIDPRTGQQKFVYDDINAIKMPNYISRNAIDIYPWAPRYGSGYDGRDDEIDVVSGKKTMISTLEEASMNKGLLDIRKNAIDAFTRSTGEARQELQTRLMSKRNGEMWQRRIAPIY